MRHSIDCALSVAAYHGFLHKPIGGGPGERLARAGFDLARSGENIALAPTTALAHAGLRTSPPHRANILNPGLTRVGIAVLRSTDHGLMATQEFAGS